MPSFHRPAQDDASDTPSLTEIRQRFAAEGYGVLSPEERMRLGLPPHPEAAGPSRESRSRRRRRALGQFQVGPGQAERGKLVSACPPDHPLLRLGVRTSAAAFPGPPAPGLANLPACP